MIHSMKKKANIIKSHTGAIGLLSVILLTVLVLVFMLTISVQIVLNVKNAKLVSDFDTIYYVTEGGLRDARMQLKKEKNASMAFSDITFQDVTVTRGVGISLTSNNVVATGTVTFITRILKSPCLVTMAGCSISEVAP
jgi:hypothetical protein